MYFCSKDCPDLCAFEFQQREGKPVFKAVPRGYIINNFVCKKLKEFYEEEVRSEAFSYIKYDDEKTKLSFAYAVRAVADFLKKHGKGDALYMRGSGSLSYGMACWDAVISKAGDFVAMDGNPCDETGIDAHVADFGAAVNPPVENLADCETIIIFGRNAKVVSPHLYTYLKELKQKGVEIIYIDPFYNETAPLADKYIRINPGYDGVLCAAVLQKQGTKIDVADEMIKKTGVSQSDIGSLAEKSASGKVGFITGFGLQRYTTGMNTVRWINKLAVKTGNEERVYYGHSSKKDFKTPSVNFERKVAVHELQEKLENDDFSAVVIIGANPVVTFPANSIWRKALGSVPVLVVDINETETSEYADVFAAVGGMFTQADVMNSYFFHDSHAREKVSDFRPSDIEFAEAVAKELGIEISDYSIESVLKKEAAIRSYKKDFLEIKEPVSGEGLRFITHSSYHWLNSQLAKKHASKDRFVRVSPKTAEELGLKEMDRVCVAGKLGSFEDFVHIDENCPDGVVSAYKNRPFEKGLANNAYVFIPTDSGTGLAYYDNFVHVEKV